MVMKWTPLALEPSPPFRVGGHLRRQHLEGHAPFEFAVLGDIDLAHAALAQAGNNLIVRDGFSYHDHAPAAPDDDAARFARTLISAGTAIVR